MHKVLGCAWAPELTVSFADPRLSEGAVTLLDALVNRVLVGGSRVDDGETVRHGYWVLKFKLESGMLIAHELNDDWSDTECGATRALRCWSEQQRVCVEHRSSFEPPVASQKVAISEGVYEGAAVDGVRYRAPAHMSGWYLTTPLYDGNSRSLQVVHLYHVTRARPELAQYLALSPGHFFNSVEGGKEIGYPESIANE